MSGLSNIQQTDIVYDTASQGTHCAVHSHIMFVLSIASDRITGDVKTMFEDVVDDFHEINLIKSHFEEWKTKQGHTYSEAYIGLCLPKLFTPIVRLQLIPWNPLEVS